MEEELKKKLSKDPNGLMTYDREVVKMDVGRVRKANEAVKNALEFF